MYVVSLILDCSNGQFEISDIMTKETFCRQFCNCSGFYSTSHIQFDCSQPSIYLTGSILFHKTVYKDYEINFKDSALLLNC